MNSQNPFEAPQHVDSQPAVAEMIEKPFRPGPVFGKWLLICSISAAPSFFWGWAVLGEQDVISAAAMVAGILTFVVLYVWIESLPFVRSKLADRRLRRAVKIGYGIRIGMSIIFPVAIILDLYCGVMSVGVVNTVLGVEGFESVSTNSAFPLFKLIQFYLTTLVQGVVLNILLGGWTLFVYVICLGIMYPVKPAPVTSAPVNPSE